MLTFSITAPAAIAAKTARAFADAVETDVDQTPAVDVDPPAAPKPHEDANRVPGMPDRRPAGRPKGSKSKVYAGKPVEEPKAEELKAEEPKAEEPKAEEPKADVTPVDEPKVDVKITPADVKITPADVKITPADVKVLVADTITKEAALLVKVRHLLFDHLEASGVKVDRNGKPALADIERIKDLAGFAAAVKELRGAQ
jgi:hypothetical protein